MPGYGPVRLEYLVPDYTGTLSADGRLLDGVREQLQAIAGLMKVIILTADTFGRAAEELEGIPCEIHVFTGKDHDVQKEEYVRQLGPGRVMAFGNCINDRRMLKIARVGVAVSQEKGCAVEAIPAADVQVTGANKGPDLLLHPKRLKATLRF